MQTLHRTDFTKVALRVGRIVAAVVFQAASKPACVLHVDFGKGLGIRQSTNQITVHCTPEQLLGRLVVAGVTLPRQQIGGQRPACRVTAVSSAW